MAPTNRVHVTRVPGAQVAFEQFGEVARVEELGSEPPRVAVVFYDVRSAARALEALGSSCCAPGPQEGERLVRLVGEANFDAQDFRCISDVRCDDGEEGRYTFEFYDIRDAARYRFEAANTTADVPPAVAAHEGAEAPQLGLETPSVLEQEAKVDVPAPEAPSNGAGTIAASLGLQRAQVQPASFQQALSGAHDEGESSKPVFQVSVRGLPKALLTDSMMQAVLQQARLGAVLGSTIKVGQPCGEVTITFSSRAAAERCVCHFRGCQWDRSGTQVHAELLRAGSKDLAVWLASSDGMPAVVLPNRALPGDALMTRSTAAPVSTKQSLASSTGAKPGFHGKRAGKVNRRTGSKVSVPGGKLPHLANSDTSTEAGESEADHEASPNAVAVR